MNSAADPLAGPGEGARDGGAAPEPAFRHVGLRHRTHDGMFEAVVPLLAAALARGDLVSAEMADADRDELRDRLGPAAGGITLTAPDDAWSGQTIAARWAAAMRVATAGGRRATLLSLHARPGTGRPLAQINEIEVGANMALQGLPVTLICPHPIGAAPAGEVVEWNHPELVGVAAAGPNPLLRPAVDVLASIPVSPAPALGPPTETVRFGGRAGAGLAGIRASAARQGMHAGLGAERTESLVLVVSELVSNGVEHGAGSGSLLWWTSPGRVVAQVHDAGRLRVGMPGMIRPAPTEIRGRGVWMARQLSDVVHLWSTPEGTSAHVEMNR